MIDENHNLARKAAVLAGRIPTSAATKSDNYLLMEINAEASRNPRLREILMQADRRLKEEGGRLSQRYHPGLKRCATQCRIRAHRRSDGRGQPTAVS
ncbi:TetR family transcriptional regulator [Klebsiella pneumoniae]|uniref:TetR family transcriptional regulator n=1 Tax=Klebsiella pneumoniae TaxID=573 RepID=A0A377XRG4_KLEPN|nr:TetR family transcriptional regulator [Klebsiella pneumoniae]